MEALRQCTMLTSIFHCKLVIRLSFNWVIPIVSAYRTRDLVQGSKEWGRPLVWNGTAKKDGGISYVVWAIVPLNKIWCMCKLVVWKLWNEVRSPRLAAGIHSSIRRFCYAVDDAVIQCAVCGYCCGIWRVVSVLNLLVL